MHKFSKKQIIVAGAAVGVLAIGGVALAYWTSTGSGTGTASTDSASWDVTIDSTDLADLSPNGPTEIVTFHVNNPNSGVQNLQTASPSVVDTTDSGCTAADFSVGAASITFGDVASGDTVDGTFSLKMIDTGENQDDCQGVTVNLRVDVT
jgi:hypothetical protein